MVPPAPTLRLETRIRRFFLGPFRAFRGWGRWLWYSLALIRGRATGSLGYRIDPNPADAPPLVVRLPVGSTTQEEALAFCRRQTLRELHVAAIDATGHERFRVDAEGPVPRSGADETVATSRWWMAPGALPDLDPSWCEGTFLIAATERVDAVVWTPDDDRKVGSAHEVHTPPIRSWAAFREEAYLWDPSTDQVQPRYDSRLVKWIPAGGVAPLEDGPRRDEEAFGPLRRGPYLSTRTLPPHLQVGIRDLSTVPRRRDEDPRTPVLVTTSFLATGGAEQTLYEVLRHLRPRFAVSLVTLAPLPAQAGDRRNDFRAIVERLIPLGDLVHPAAMEGILLSLLDATGARVLHNANGTTLFYELVPALVRRRPGLRVVDHLFDHRVGYIERYRTNGDLLDSVSAVVAENHPIHDVLVGECGWSKERVPVIWPCARPQSAFPTGDRAIEVRRRLRRELGLAEDDLVVLTAARLHPQKRPWDWIELARRFRDRPEIVFVWAGGGVLELGLSAQLATARADGARLVPIPFRPDVPELIAMADAGLLVSEYEGLPVFLLECLQGGRPFVGPAVGDLERLVERTQAGAISGPPGDIDGLEAALRRMLEPQERAHRSAQARASAADLSIPRCAELYAEAFLGSDREPSP